MTRPTIVCLCGSTKFKTTFEQANRDETLLGRIVLGVAVFGHIDGVDADAKVMLDELHFAKIDLADEILVLNVGGYIGYSTRREINYATTQSKVIRYLEAI